MFRLLYLIVVYMALALSASGCCGVISELAGNESSAESGDGDDDDDDDDDGGAETALLIWCAG